MKLLKYIGFAIVASAMFFSCADEPLPFETYDELGKGGLARLLSTDGGTFIFTDPDNSSFDFEVEFYDENNGNDIAAHEWTVRHRNNVTGDISEPAVLERKEASSFSPNSVSGLPSTSYSFSLNEALAALGLTIGDVNGGDDMIFDGFVIMNDGRRFGPDNTGTAIAGGAGFDGIYRFVKPLLCPSFLDNIDESSEDPLVDDVHEFTTTLAGGTPCSGAAGSSVSGTMRFHKVSDGEYAIYTRPNGGEVEFLDAAFGIYFECWGYDPTDPSAQGSMPQSSLDDEAALTIVDACEILSWKGTSQWSEVYTFNSVTVNGNELTLDWANDYGEAAVTVIRRTGGADWPPLTSN